MGRKVTIELRGDTWAIVYVDRKKGQRYWAGAFYAPDHTREQVVDWVKNDPRLELVETKI